MGRGVQITLAALAATVALGGAVVAAPVSAALPACTVQGTDGNDVFQASDYPADAVICGGKGDDTVKGVLQGIFVGGPGNDKVLTSEGTVYGGAGRDRVRWNREPGRFFGGVGADAVGGGDYGNEGTFRGQDGPDTIRSFNSGVFRGGPGNDRIVENLPWGTFYGARGADRVATNIGLFYGGSGADTVDSNAIANIDPGIGEVRGRFYGQVGNDHVDWNGGTFWGGLGFDTVDQNVGVFKPGPQ